MLFQNMKLYQITILMIFFKSVGPNITRIDKYRIPIILLAPGGNDHFGPGENRQS